MRPRWSLVVLALSVSMHLGVLGIFGWERYQSRQAEDRFCREALTGRPALAELDRLYDQYASRRRRLLHEYDATLREFGLLAEEPDPDPARLEALLDDLEQNDAGVTWTGIDFTLQSDTLYRPGYQRAWRERGLAYLDSALAGRRAPGRRGTR